ncbi:hypothetical protein B0H11DRAFT_2361720, partial [Mycena galericulata]
LRRVYAVHPIAAIQVEYSPFTLDIEDPKINLLNTARELGVKIVAYSPLGRGLLTGQCVCPIRVYPVIRGRINWAPKSTDDFEEGDFRKVVPRYNPEDSPNILKLADGLNAIGAKNS